MCDNFFAIVKIYVTGKEVKKEDVVREEVAGGEEWI